MNTFVMWSQKSVTISKMAHYTVEQAASLVEASDISDGSDSELEEDSAFPLPTLDSDDDVNLHHT